MRIKINWLDRYDTNFRTDPLMETKDVIELFKETEHFQKFQKGNDSLEVVKANFLEFYHELLPKGTL